MEIQSESRDSTPLQPYRIVTVHLTPSARDPAPVSERPQDTITAMELDQASLSNSKPAPEAVMTIDEQAPTDESPGRTYKVEPVLNVPRNIDIPRDIEIISIASTDPEEEEGGDEIAVLDFTDATLEPEIPPGPAKQPGAAEEGKAGEEGSLHPDESQGQAQIESLPSKANADSSRASEQAQETPQHCRPTVSTPRAASDGAADLDQPRQDGAWRESESWPLPTPTRRDIVARETTMKNIHAILVKHGLFDLARRYENPS